MSNLREYLVQKRAALLAKREKAAAQALITQIKGGIKDERKRLGFDLHDDVCQELVGIGILAESVRRRASEEAPALVDGDEEEGMVADLHHQAGVDLVADGWYGMWLPAGSPPVCRSSRRDRGSRHRRRNTSGDSPARCRTTAS